jgi:hypothetical protein
LTLRCWSGAGAAIVEITATKLTFDLQSSVTGFERPIQESEQPLAVFSSHPNSATECPLLARLLPVAFQLLRQAAACPPSNTLQALWMTPRMVRADAVIL